MKAEEIISSLELFTLNMISFLGHFLTDSALALITGRGGLTEWDWEILRGLEGGEILLQFWLIRRCNNRFTRTGEHLNQTYSVYLCTLLSKCHKTGGGEAKENTFPDKPQKNSSSDAIPCLNSWRMSVSGFIAASFKSTRDKLLITLAGWREKSRRRARLCVCLKF